MPKPNKKKPAPIDDMELLDFLERFPDEKSAMAYFVDLRWHQGLCCAQCGNRDESTIGVQERPPQPYYCKVCRRYFSVRTGTVMASSKISMRNWLLGIYLVTVHDKGISSPALARELGITQKSAWHLRRRIRLAYGGRRTLFPPSGKRRRLRLRRIV